MKDNQADNQITTNDKKLIKVDDMVKANLDSKCIKNDGSVKKVAGNLSFEPEFREYVLQTLEPENDISRAYRGDESLLSEGKRNKVNKRKRRHQ